MSCKVRTQTQACSCKIEIPVGIRAGGRLAVNEYLRILLCGYRPHYMPMICPICRTPFLFKIVKE